MISFKNIMTRILTEVLTFRQLLSRSEPGRILRGKNDVKSRSIRVTSMNGDEAWMFSYKSNPSTTGKRWHGYVRFLKENVDNARSAEDLECMVDCDCPDYRYRWAYNNAKDGSGITGPNSWNKNNGKPPRPKSMGGVGDMGVGLCKHLVSLSEYLKTKIDPTAPEPEEKESLPIQPSVSVPVKSTKSVASAPEKPTTQSPYSDTRSGDLMENKSIFRTKLDSFVENNPEFDVYYNDEE